MGVLNDVYEIKNNETFSTKFGLLLCCVYTVFEYVLVVKCRCSGIIRFGSGRLQSSPSAVQFVTVT